MKKSEKISNFKFLISNVEQGLLFLFLLLIPTQLGRHFWPSWSMVMGVRVDYLSPTLYLIDIIWFVWVGIKIFNLKFLIFNQRETIFNFQNILVGLFVVLNILVAGNRWVAVYRWIRVGQLVLTFKLFRSQISDIRKMLGWIIPCWIIMETLLGVGQIIKGGSLQGIWYWLGERRFSFTGIGVAQISWLGNGIVRAYGTFSHPNSLGGFLLVVLCYWIRRKDINKILWWTVFWMGIIGIIISGSRVVWGTSLLILVMSYELKVKSWKKMLGMGVVGIGVILIILGMIGVNYSISDFVGGWDSDSLMKRVTLNIVAIKMIKENLFLGIGMGNFTYKLPEYVADQSFYWWQPVHNVFLLWLAETGILGTLLLIKFQILNFKFQNLKKNWLILGAIVVTGMVDHYWLTLPQNSWLLMVVLSVL